MDLTPHLPLAYAAAGRMLRRYPQFTFDELLGEGLIGLWRAGQRWRHFAGSASFRHYVGFRVRGAIHDYVRNELGFGRKSYGRICSLTGFEGQDGELPFAFPERAADRFDELLAPLAETDREVCRLYFERGLRQREIARRLCRSVSWVSVRLAWSLEQIRASLLRRAG